MPGRLGKSLLLWHIWCQVWEEAIDYLFSFLIGHFSAMPAGFLTDFANLAICELIPCKVGLENGGGYL
jgi:hypothetical protein